MAPQFVNQACLTVDAKTMSMLTAHTWTSASARWPPTMKHPETAERGWVRLGNGSDTPPPDGCTPWSLILVASWNEFQKYCLAGLLWYLVSCSFETDVKKCIIIVCHFKPVVYLLADLLVNCTSCECLLKQSCTNVSLSYYARMMKTVLNAYASC